MLNQTKYRHKKPKSPEMVNILEEIESDDDDENNQVEYELSSSIIKISYLNLIKYSQVIQKNILQNNINDCMAAKLKKIQISDNIDEENIKTFFQLLNEEDVMIKNEQYIDLCKLTNIFEVKPLEKFLKKYLKSHSNDIDFILTLKIESERDNDSDIFSNNEYSVEMENFLSENIDECFQNEKFQKVSASSIFRIVEKSGINKKVNNLLCDFICESIEERYILFCFVDSEQLSDVSLENLLLIYNDDKYVKKKYYFDHIKNSLDYIKTLKEKQYFLEQDQNKLKKRNKNLSVENKQYSKQIIELTEENQQLQKQLDNKEIEYKKEINELNKSNQQLQRQLDNKEIEYKKEINELKKTNQQLQKLRIDEDERDKKIAVKRNKLLLDFINELLGKCCHLKIITKNNLLQACQNGNYNYIVSHLRDFQWIDINSKAILKFLFMKFSIQVFKFHLKSNILILFQIFFFISF